MQEGRQEKKVRTVTMAGVQAIIDALLDVGISTQANTFFYIHNIVSMKFI